MEIRFFDPLGRAFGRMKKALFQPLNPRKWFVVGFTAFLAGLTDCHGGNGGGGGRGRRGGVDWDELIYFPRHAEQWLLDNPHWFLLIIVALTFLVILAILLTWLSSRGKFMFLDNVVHDRAQVSRPWYEYREQGNSLFLWNFTVGLITITIVVAYLIFSYSIIVGVYEQYWEPSALIAPAVMLALGLLAIFVVAAFLDRLVVDFIVPIMYRSKSKVLGAWGVFFPLLVSRLFSFIGYGLFYLFLSMIIVIGIVLLTVVTCCLALLLLIIPYISAVFLLPVSYTLRSFSVEFLEQFGPEYHVFPRVSGEGGA